MIPASVDHSVVVEFVRRFNVEPNNVEKIVLTPFHVEISLIVRDENGQPKAIDLGEGGVDVERHTVRVPITWPPIATV